jgi:hypothetical protein
MEPVITNPATVATGTTSGVVNATPFDLLTPLLRLLSGSEGIPGFLNLGAALSFLNIVWLIIVVLGYLMTVIFLSLMAYASSRKSQLEELVTNNLRRAEQIYDEQYRTGPKNDRLKDVLTHIQSDNPNDWKLAIIEADIILDDILKHLGYAGVSLGERLRSISPNQLQSLDAAWEAHKVRNNIAHGGIDFVLTRRLAEDTIKQYKQVFSELGVS